MVRGSRYRDRPTADPPDATLSQLPRDAIVVFAVIYQSTQNTEKRIVLHFDRARRYRCCDGTAVAGGEYTLAGAGPAAAYSVNVASTSARPQRAPCELPPNAPSTTSNFPRQDEPATSAPRLRQSPPA